MSFDIFLGCFQNGKSLKFPQDIVEKALGQYVAERRKNCWVLSFPDGGRSFLYIDDDNQVGDFSVNRPAASLELWQGLLDILRQTSTVLYWPGGGCVVGNAAVIPHLPPDMIKSLGTPIVATDTQTILDMIKRS
jgi:hypothetical protein